MIIAKIVCFIGNLVFKLFVSNKPEPPKKIILFKSGAIGDVLMTTPLIRAMRNEFKNAIIDYWTGEWSASILNNNTYLTNVIKVDDTLFHTKNPFTKIKLLLQIKKRKYDTAFILDKSWLANFFIWMAGISQRVGFDRCGEGFPNTYSVNYGALKHEINYYLELANFFGINSNNTKLDLFLSIEDLSFAEDFTTKHKITKNKIIGIIPGGAYNPGRGYDKTRIWPEENYTNLIKILQKKYIIFLFGGNNDIKLHQEILSNISSKNIYDLAGKITIHQTAALMRYCEKIICNDSGPMHIASAMNKPVITIFGCTHPKRKLPLTKGSKAVWKNEDRYDAKVDLYSTKYGEGKNWFKDVSVEEVIKFAL